MLRGSDGWRTRRDEERRGVRAGNKIIEREEREERKGGKEKGMDEGRRQEIEKGKRTK